MLVAEAALVFAGATAGAYGLDRYLLPTLRAGLDRAVARARAGGHRPAATGAGAD